jgi:hypothetical protein
MLSRLRPITLALLALAAASLGACGDSHTRVMTGTYSGESGKNAPYLDVGELIYEVQLSRELNPNSTEDAAYLQGLSARERRLEPGQEWFGVFVQVYNHTSSTQTAAGTLTIGDTEGKVYSPVSLAQTNQFAYRGGPLPASGQLPTPGSVAAAGPTQGALLLYKIDITSLDNRPLKIKIVDPNDPTQTASAELDV